MRWSVERRLEFIDFRLYWEGRINRKDLTDFFNISVPQASSDLRIYQEKAPDNIDYDKSGKFYFATDKFKPAFKTTNSSYYFAQLRLIFNDVLKEEESFLGQIPNFGSIPNPARFVNSEILRDILFTINNKMSLDIKYQSMSREQPIWRTIAPHTLAYDGFRWHTRAYCYIHNDFRDFLLIRILKTRNKKPAEIDSSEDVSWHKFIDVKIEPHPELSESQKKIVERDYGMTNGLGIIKVRASLYFYLERHLGLDEKCASRPPKEQQIILVNRDEINVIKRQFKI
ncbi:MAG: WYL domain-containing protein [Desulfobacterales bacterium]|nr:WYL domain-containing protein [Desulfobacterales bacterium]